MAKQTDRQAYHLVNPPAGGYFLGVDENDTSASPQGTTKAFYLDRLAKSFETRADFVSAVSSGFSQPEGNVVSAAGLTYKAKSSATTIIDLPGWMPAGDWYADHFGDNTTPGTTDMTAVLQAAVNGLPVIGSTTDDPAIDYRSGEIKLRPVKYRINGQLTVPPGVSIAGPEVALKYNTPGLVDEACGATLWLTYTGSGNCITVQGKQLRGSGSRFKNITFSHGQTNRQSGSYPGNAVYLDGAFMFALENCNFFELGYQKALTGNLANGIRVDSCNFVKIGNPNNQQSMPPASGYTFGDGIDFSAVFDSFIINTFVEACGGTGVTLSSNNKIEASFIDLCANGVKLTGKNCQVVGCSIKWHQSHGVQLDSANSAVLSGNIIQGNNYASRTTAATVGYAVRFINGASTNVLIVGNNFLDDYAGTSHDAYKTVKQAAINLGSGASTAIISSNFFDAADAQWDASLQSNYPFTDNAGRITPGFVLVDGNLIEGAGPSNLRSMPFTTAAGTTLGSVTRRIAYRDQNGTTIGQIPIYDTIT